MLLYILIVVILLYYFSQQLVVPIRVYYSHKLTSQQFLSLNPMSTISYNFLELLNQAQTHSNFSLDAKYFPTFYLFNGYLQTVYTSLTNSTREPEVGYLREVLTVPDGGTFALDWVNRIPKGCEIDNNQDKVLVLVLHGLTGSSSELYIRRLITKLLDNPKVNQHIDIVVQNFRGCGGVSLTSEGLYNAFDTKDLNFGLNYLKKLQYKKVLSIGYSLGSNLLVTYLGEKGSESYIDGAVSICNPYDLTQCSAHLKSSWFESTFVDRILGIGLVNLMESHNQIFKESTFDLSQVRGVRDFDRVVTAKLGKFASVDEYYRKGSCNQYLPKVQVPLLLFTCEDDIIAPKVAIPYQLVSKNENLLLVTTKVGGHLGSYYGVFKPNSLIDDLVLDFLIASLQVIYDRVPLSNEKKV